MTASRVGRQARVAATALLTLTLLGVASPAPVSGACVGPSLSATNKVRSGGTVTIHGRYFFSECDDTGSVGGCGVPRDPVTGPGNPMENVRVTISQEGKTYLLGRRDANKRFRFHLTATVPTQLAPGNARLKATADGFTVARQRVVVTADGTGTRVDP